MSDAIYAGYTLQARRPAAAATVEHWRAAGPRGPADVFVGGDDLLARAAGLPAWGPFPALVTGTRDGRRFVVAPGELREDLEDLRERLTPGACVALAWHLAAALAEVHERGAAHGALHPAYAGVDAAGQLTVRPALAAALPGDPDPAATAISTDCLLLAGLFEVLDLERVDDPGVPLVLSGLRRDSGRLRLHPGRSVRQALAAVLRHHPDWEASLTEALGTAFHRDAAPRAPVAPRARPTAGPAGSATAPARGAAVAVSGPLPSAAGAPAAVARAASVSLGPAGAPAAQTGAATASPVAPAAAAPLAAAASIAVPPVSTSGSTRSVLLPAPAARPEPSRADPPGRLVVAFVPADAPEVADKADEAADLASEPPRPRAAAAVSVPAASAPAAVRTPPAPRPPLPAPVSVETDEAPDPRPRAAPPPSPAAPAAPAGPPTPDATELPDDDPLPPLSWRPERVDDEATDHTPTGHVRPSEEIPYEVDDESTQLGGDSLPAAPLPPSRTLAPVATATLSGPAPSPAPPPFAAPSPAPPPFAAPSPAPPPFPAPSAAPLDADEEPPASTTDLPPRGSVGDGARWDGLRGVTGDASRERELGAGKWQESARSLDEVRRQMDAEPVREMEPVEASAGSWPMLAMGAVLLLLLVALYLWATGAFDSAQALPAG